MTGAVTGRSRRLTESATAAAIVLSGAAVGLHAHGPLPLSLGIVVASALVAPTLTLRVAVAMTGLTVHLPFVPWPVPALAGFLAWAITQRLARGSVLERGPTSRVRAMPLWCALGLAGGVIAVAASWSAIQAAPLLAPLQEPGPLALVVMVLTLASLNAMAEEGLWRGAFYQEGGRFSFVLVLSHALSFGLAHLGGIPSGWVGVLLAACFSVVMVWIRRRAGLFAAIVAHLGADVVIVYAVLTTAIYPPT